jgi:hypothetical protein
MTLSLRLNQTDHRPCERKCPDPPAGCGQWKHHSRFASRKISNGTVCKIYFDPICRDRQQKERNEKKNEDRPLAIIRGRAQGAASKARTTTEFFWVQMNYRALVAPFRALMSEEGLCQGCGHRFVNERDIQIDHCCPPRHAHDWARLHARNLRFSCGSCNNTKATKDFADWLDEQESARLSNLEPEERASFADDDNPQLALF